MTEFRELRIEHGGGIFTGVERGGRGTPIILLHGVGGNALWFKPLIPALAGRRVIAFDMPGHGGSTPAPDWEMEPLTELIFSMSRQVVKGPVIWGGHSWGGKLAAMIAGTHPEAAHAMLLLDPSPASGIPIPAEMFVDVTFAGELGPWPSIEAAINAVRGLPQYSNWNGDLRRAFERGLTRGADGMLRARISRDTLIAVCTAAGKDHSGTVRRASCPTLIAVADESLAWQEAINFAVLPNATRSVIKSNHWLMTGNPAELNRAVETWLATGLEQCALKMAQLA